MADRMEGGVRIIRACRALGIERLLPVVPLSARRMRWLSRFLDALLGGFRGQELLHPPGRRGIGCGLGRVGGLPDQGLPAGVGHRGGALGTLRARDGRYLEPG